MRLRGNKAALAASLLLFLFAAGGIAEPASAAEPSATRILDAQDHAELDAGIAMDGVVRVALLDDRIARVIHAREGVSVEHDPDEGDIYIRLPEDGAGEAGSFALFVGSEKGFTYRLTLAPVPDGSAQLLIRNPATARGAADAAGAGGDTRITDITALIRAVASRELLAGYRIDRNSEQKLEEDGGAVLEVWRGMRREAWLLALDETEASLDAQALAADFGPGVVAAWIDDAELAGARLAVIVREGAGDDR